MISPRNLEYEFFSAMSSRTTRSRLPVTLKPCTKAASRRRRKERIVLIVENSQKLWRVSGVEIGLCPIE